MGYVMKLKLASFIAGTAVASVAGVYIIYKDYNISHLSLSDQMKLLHDSLDERVSSLEKLQQAEVPREHVKST
ncbi:hypothetical protein KSS87_005595 [Heliosperma pusillum]|nr:hypothetical protein KSS87_005595 [Heliosperma pusillum]